jgi:hypothetical protein
VHAVLKREPKDTKEYSRIAHPLIAAASNGHVDICSLLLQQAVSEQAVRNALRAAAAEGQMAAVQLLVKELKSRCGQDREDYDLRSEALCAAVSAGHLQVIRIQWYHNPCMACALMLVSGH